MHAAEDWVDRLGERLGAPGPALRLLISLLMGKKILNQDSNINLFVVIVVLLINELGTGDYKESFSHYTFNDCKPLNRMHINLFSFFQHIHWLLFTENYCMESIIICNTFFSSLVDHILVTLTMVSCTIFICFHFILLQHFYYRLAANARLRLYTDSIRGGLGVTRNFVFCGVCLCVSDGVPFGRLYNYRLLQQLFRYNKL